MHATSSISVVAMTGAAIAIDDAADTDTILSVKKRVNAVNPKLPVRRQRLVYRPGPRGMEALADDETLGGAGVAQDGTAKLDVLVEPLTDAEVAALGQKVCYFVFIGVLFCYFRNAVIFRTSSCECVFLLQLSRIFDAM